MPKLSYSEKLKDVRWQKKRLEVLTAANWRCEDCGDGGDEGGVSLQVHHNYYSRGVEPWDYPMKCYAALCESCHIAREESREELLSTLYHLAWFVRDDIHYFVSEFNGADDEYFGELVRLIHLATYIRQAYTPGAESVQPRRDLMRAHWVEFMTKMDTDFGFAQEIINIVNRGKHG